MVDPKKQLVSNADPSLHGRILSWIGAQEFNNVLLLAILASAWHFAAVNLPLIVDKMNEHLTRTEERHRAERKSVDELHTRQIEAVINLVKDKATK